MPDQNIPPEVMAAYMRQLTQEQEDQDLQQQIAMAHELMQAGPQRYGAVGAGLQGLADIVGAVRGGGQMRQAHGQQKDLRGRMQADRTLIGQNWAQGQMPQAPAEQPIPAGVQGPEDFSQPVMAQIPDLLRRPMGG